ncbi:DUF5518 domain-containing protein [Halorarius litoreus]|uniref:DUF5518 domain-containing protein n=1 Tax=Halorarius litoreus TaxID=2962676 RepID=UPI0020CE2905|nr:DUF5518 domain-containing protein [Halorarius litoreus]
MRWSRPFSARCRLSELVGGSVAGYLHGERGLAVGALSGVFAAVPKAALLFVLLVAIGAGSGEAETLAVQFAAVLVGMTVFLAAVGALAGYLGVYLYRNRTNRPDRPH